MPAARTIAVGDVHGCSKALNALIDAIRPTPDDVVVMLGDYVNRGPDSRGVLDALAELRGKCRLVPLLGNHDEMALRVNDGTVDELEVAIQRRRDWVRELPKLRPANLEFLRSCLDYYETDAHIFVHASY